jgi:very-short-patch-repair endonuclease
MVYIKKSIERDMYYGAKPELIRLALKMRKTPTKAEIVLWKNLKKLRNEGFIFRRQHPIEFFVADFYCHKAKLVVEADGEIHAFDKTKEKDESRSGELDRFGIKIIRFKNEEIINNIDLVIFKIKNQLKDLTSSSLLGEGE